MKRLIIGLMALGHFAQAGTLLGLNDHDWAHLGTSYAIQTLSYGLLSEVFDKKKEHRIENVIASMIVTNMITTAYMFVNTSGANNHDFGMNLLGSAIGVAATFAFHF